MKQQSLLSLFLRYVIPTVIAMFISGAYQLVDGVFIGNIVGRDGLAAVNIGWSYITLLLGFGLMVGVGVGSHYSLAIGAGDEERALRVLGQIPTILVVSGVILGGLLYLYGEALVAIPNANRAASLMATEFVTLFALAAPMVIGSLAMPFIVRNVGTPMRAMLYMSIGILLNILASYLFIVALKWGVYGAALASILGESLAMILGGYYLIRFIRRRGIRARHFIPRGILLKDILLNGSSAFFLYIYVGVMILLHHIQLERYGGTLAISAYTITGYLITLYYFAVEGVANGVQPLLSTLYGSQRYQELRGMVRLTLWVGLGIGLLFTIALQLYPHFFALLFIHDDALLLAAAVHAIRYQLPLLFLEGLFVIATIFFQSIGEGQKALLVALGNLLFQVPILFIAPHYFGLDGIWITIPIAAILLALPIGYLFLRRYRLLI